MVEDIEESEEVFFEDIISSRELFQGATCECAGDTMCSEDCMCQSDGLRAPLYALGKEKRNAITVFHISYKLDND